MSNNDELPNIRKQKDRYASTAGSENKTYPTSAQKRKTITTTATKERNAKNKDALI